MEIFISIEVPYIMFRMGDRFSLSLIMKILAYNFRAITATALQANTFPDLLVKIIE